MAGSQILIALTQIEKQRLGYQAISLTNFALTTEPQIAAGSKVEIGEALFEFTAPESITGWAGIGVSQNVYIKLTVAGVAVTASFTITAPTWSESKQGFYVGLDRYIGGLYKDGGGLYTKKYVYGKWFENNLNIKIRADGSIETVSNLTAGGTLTLTGKTFLAKGINPKGTYHGEGVTENDLFDLLSPAIPNIGDMCIISGGMTLWYAPIGGVVFVFSRAQRITATRVDLYFCSLTVDTGYVNGTIQLDDGDATVLASGGHNYRISIAW